MSEIKYIYKSIREAYNQDQKERKGLDWKNPKAVAALNRNDLKRQTYAKRLLNRSLLKTSADYYYAAMLFHHSDHVQNLAIALALSLVSMQLGNSDGRWLYARVLDRFMLTIGQPQKFGTQFEEKNGAWILCEYDSSTNDAERALYDVPPLNYQKNIRAKELNEGN